MIAQREIRQGDEITGMVVIGRMSQTLWSGEFVATYGDGKVGRFVSGCDKDAIAFIYPVLEDGTVTVLTNHHMASPTL